jgi:hypothetical protein
MSPSARLCQRALRAQGANGTANSAKSRRASKGVVMHTYAATGAGFLLAVLWFDLMFDVQTRKHAGNVLPRRCWRQSRPITAASPPKPIR